MTQVGINYAGGLYALGLEEGLTGQLLEEMDALEQSFVREPAFLRLLSAPNITKQERCRTVDDLFRGKVHPYMLNFLMLLTEKGYARYFGDCCKAFRQLYDRDNGILRVSAVTAVKLTDEQSRRLTEKLADTTGKNVVLTNTVEPDCLGGVKLRYDGVQVDGTVRSRLEAVGSLLKNTQL